MANRHHLNVARNQMSMSGLTNNKRPDVDSEIKRQASHYKKLTFLESHVNLDGVYKKVTFLHPSIIVFSWIPCGQHVAYLLLSLSSARVTFRLGGAQGVEAFALRLTPCTLRQTLRVISPAQTPSWARGQNRFHSSSPDVPV
jgi:hypothetical protein